MSRKRLFIALLLPNDIKYELTSLRLSKGNINWSPLDNYHITLKFLGSIDKSNISSIRDSLKSIEFKKFKLELSSVGFFGSDIKPRVLWAGIRASEDLFELQKKIEQRIERLNLQIECQFSSYRPHVTLGRPKRIQPEQLGEFIKDFSLYKSRPFDVGDFFLMESISTGDGPLYKVIEKFNI